MFRIFKKGVVYFVKLQIKTAWTERWIISLLLFKLCRPIWKCYFEFSTKHSKFLEKKVSRKLIAKLSAINYETNIFRSKIVTCEYQITFPAVMSKVE